CPACGAVGVAMNVVSAIVTCVQGEAIACATNVAIAATGGAGMALGRALKPQTRPGYGNESEPETWPV
ncbi:MAG: hypothetical protein ABI140_08545, partial [Jatrophihabitantaceae bacterium]